jgi:hypothetical protein
MRGALLVVYVHRNLAIAPWKYRTESTVSTDLSIDGRMEKWAIAKPN